jgi:hypothetical protein
MLAFPHSVKYINREDKPERIFASRISDHTLIDVTPEYSATNEEIKRYYCDEFVFRFNRRRSRSRGLLFYRLIEGAVATDPHPYKDLLTPQMKLGFTRSDEGEVTRHTTGWR